MVIFVNFRIILLSPISSSLKLSRITYNPRPTYRYPLLPPHSRFFIPKTQMSCDDPTLYIGPTDQMIFGPIDLGDESPYHHHDQHLSSYSWDPYADVDQDVKPSHFSFASTSPALLSPSYSASLQHSSPPDSYYDPSSVHDQDDMSTEVGQSYINWINDPDGTSAYNSSSPIPIPSSAPAAASPTYMAFSDASHYHSNAFSPTGFAALHPLPRSLSPSSAYDEHQIHSISPQDMSLATPHWASQAWDVSSSLRSPSTIRASVRHSPLTDSTIRASRMPARRGPISSHLFHSSSAPSMSPTLTRALSNRRVPPMSNNSMLEDHDATIRRKKRGSPVDEGSPIPEKGDKADKKDDIRKFPLSISIPSLIRASSNSWLLLHLALKSVLRPPKLAPSAWQLYFTDWIQRQQATSTRKLNVAQAAKEAGQEYASLSQEEKEVSTPPLILSLTSYTFAHFHPPSHSPILFISCPLYSHTNYDRKPQRRSANENLPHT